MREHMSINRIRLEFKEDGEELDIRETQRY